MPTLIDLKGWTRNKQKHWAESLAMRIQPVLPLGVYAHAAGWWPGCEPIFQFNELEWVEIAADIGPHAQVAHRLHYPDDPTDDEIVSIANGLLDSAGKFR